MAIKLNNGRYSTAKDLDELIKVATLLKKMYGNIQLTHEISMSPMPAGCYAGFDDDEVVEIDLTERF